MENRNRLSDAIVLMLIVMMWTGLIFVAIWLAFGWLVESFGREMAMVTTFALGGVVLAIVLWIASSRHTTNIWRSALHYASDTQDMSVSALRILSGVQREVARADTYHARATAQMQMQSHRALLAEIRKADSAPSPAASATQRNWAMADDDAVDADDFQWTK